MTYNVRDRRGRFTKVRHNYRDPETGRFVPEPVNRHNLRDEVGRFRAAKKYNVRDERGRFVEQNYRHNLRDPLTGRFVSAKKNTFLPWEDEYDCDCAFCRGDEDVFADTDADYDDEGLFDFLEEDYDWGKCECPPDEVIPDEDADGTRFCANCLGDLPAEVTPDLTQEDVIVLIVVA